MKVGTGSNALPISFDFVRHSPRLDAHSTCESFPLSFALGECLMQSMDVLERNVMPTITRENLHEHRGTHDKSNSWWMGDAKGIPLCRVCEDCIEVAESMYRPEVLGVSGRYEDVIEENIEPDEF